MNKLLPSLVVVLTCSLLAAITAPDSLKTYLLPTVKVIVEKPSEAIGSVKQLSPGDNEAAMSLRETFINSVGISASTGTKDESNIRLRGFRKNEVKIMIDGRPINNGYFGNVDLSKLSLMGVKEIQIVKGPASPLYGTNSMGGVVNIITKEPSKRSWLTLGAMIKRNNTQQFQATTAHSFDSWNYSLGASAERTDGFILSQDFQPTYFENGGVRNNSSKNQYNLRGSLSSELFNFHQVSLDFGYSTIGHKDIPSSIYERKFRYYQDWHRNYASLTGEFVLGERTALLALLTNDGGGDRYMEFNDAAHQYLNVDSRMVNNSWGFAPRLKWTLSPKASLDIGYRADLQTSKRKDNMDYPDWTNSTLQIHNGFVQYETQATSNLLVTSAFGLTGSYNELNRNTQWVPEPAIGATYTSANGSITAVAVGQNSAQPTMRQLFSYDKGNPRLKPQRSLKLELNHQQPIIMKTLSLSGSVFYNDTRDLIDLKLGQFENIYRVLSYGTELGLIFSPIPAYELEVNYAYLDFDKTSDYRLTETPKHAVEFCNRLQLPRHSRLLISSSYRDDRLSQDELGNYHTLPSYWRHDVQLKIPVKRYSITAGMENILDADYQGEYGFPEAGRNYNLGIEATF